MRWVLGLVLLMAGCAAKPVPEPVSHVREQAAPRRVKPTLKARAPRPEIDVSAYLPDFHDELRWPLSGMSHPVLEPKFSIAQELAIGVEWRELCARGVHTRISATKKELLSYLHAWCDVLKRDTDSAVAHLEPLLGSLTRGLTTAVREDLANILAADGSQAEHWLNKHDIRDTATLDLLAATLVEVGSEQDAAAINVRAIDSDRQASPGVVCRRLAKRILLSTDDEHTLAVEALRVLAGKPKLPDPICVAMRDKVACWREPATGCHLYHRNEQINPRALYLLGAYFSWPYEGNWSTWWNVVDRASRALPLEGAAELAVSALEAAVTTTRACPGGVASHVGHVMNLIRSDPSNARYEPRLQALVERCPLPPQSVAQPVAAPTP